MVASFAWMCCLSAFGGFQVETNWVVNPPESGTSWATWSTVLTNQELLSVGFANTTGTVRPRVMRTDTNGVVLFDHVYDTAIMTNYDVSAIYVGQMANSNVFVGCTAKNNGAPGALFMTLNPAGSTILSQTLVSTAPMRYMLNAYDEVLVVSGGLLSLYSTDGAAIDSRGLVASGYASGRSVELTADGGYIVSGNAGDSSVNQPHALLSRFDSRLTLLWSQRYYDTNGAQIAYCAVENPDGTFTACGSEEGGSNDKRLLFKTDSAGSRLWVQTEAAGAYGGWNTVVPTDDNGFIAVGLSFNYDLAAGYDSNGVYRWGYSFYNEGSLRGIVSVTTNQYLLSGQNGSTMGAGGGDWLAYSLQVDFNQDIVVDSILPFEPNDSNGWSLVTLTGVTNHFEFDGYDPDGVPLTYSWMMPNQQEELIELSTNSAFDLTMPPESAGSWSSLQLAVSDGFNEIWYSWNIEVSNRATVVEQLLPFEPSNGNSNVTVRAGGTELFQFDGYDPDGNALQYRWTLDGGDVSTTNLFSFSPAVAETLHSLTLTVTVIPEIEESVYTWQITVPALFAPYEASAVSPWSGETGVSAGKTPTLSWNLNADEDHPVEWTAVYFSTNSHSVTWLFPDAEVLNDGSTCATNYTAPAQLEYEQDYFWRIVCHNAIGVSTSAVFSFTTGALPQAPYEPNALSPWDGETGVRIDSAIQWGFSYDAGHPADSSDLYFSTDSNLVDSLDGSVRVVSGGPADGRYTLPGGMTPGQLYYWRVVGHNTSGATTGSVWSFTTEEIQTLPYSEGFDGGLPNGWRTLMNGGWNGGGLEGGHLEQDWSGWSPVGETNRIRSGAGAIGLSGGMPALHWLESPLFSVETNTELSAWIYYGPDEWENPPAPLHLLVKSGGIWSTVRTWTASETNRYQSPVTVPLADYAGEAIRIAWVYDLTTSGAPVALDDLLIQNGAISPATNFTLTVHNGNGSGTYPQHAVIDISANTPPTGQKFSAWTGAAEHLASATSAVTTITMPASNITVTATYADRDTDGDGMDDDWETTYLGGLKNDGTSDSDGDGMADREEFIAGTNPAESNSVFKVISIRMGSPTVLNWSGVSGRVYSVYWSTNLTGGFQCLESNIPFSRGSFTNSGGIRGFYRIDVQLEN